MGLYIWKYPYRKVLLPIAKKLRFVNPDLISYAATLVTIGTAFCYYYARSNSYLLLWAIGLTLLRMTLNTLDGVIAIERGNLRLKGEIVNALPDRYSDVFYMFGITMSSLCKPVYGVLGIISMFLVSYSGMLGKALGVDWQHQGPLGKVERLIIIMFFTLLQFIQLQKGSVVLNVFDYSLTPLEWGMIFYLVLGQLTVYNRLRGMLKQIRKKEWLEREGQPEKRVLIVYDSLTGNTQKIAEELSYSLKADLKKADEVKQVKSYDLIIIGSPNIRGNPTKKIDDFIKKYQKDIKEYAVFITYGMPIWGPYSTTLCFSHFQNILGKKPLLTFSCKGYHAKYKTYKRRPNESDLLDSFLFGIKLARVSGWIK